MEREIAKDTKLEVGYVGSHGVHQLSAYDINQYHDFPTLGNVWMYGDTASSIYHSLQVAFNGRLGTHLQWQSAYTFSKLISDTSGNWFGEIQNGKFDAITDIHNPQLDRGLSEQNRPHVLAMNLIYNLPSFNGMNGFMKHTLGGWEAATIVTLTSGSSMSVFQGGSTPARPNLVPGQSCNASGSDESQIFNKNAWTAAPAGSLTGNSPRGVCLGPGYANTDFAVYKNFKIKAAKLFSEGAKLQIRMEFFNVFNHPNFTFANNGNSNLDWTQANFGQATGTRGSREIQYAAKFIF